MRTTSVGPTRSCSGPTSSLLLDLDHEIGELLPRFRQKVGEDIDRNMYYIAGGEFVTLSACDLRSSNFMRRCRLRIDDTASDDQASLPRSGLQKSQLLSRAVQPRRHPRDVPSWRYDFPTSQVASLASFCALIFGFNFCS